MDPVEPRPFDLVIFDCDGVLVDSEPISVRVDAVVLAELGWALTETEIAERFVGRTSEYMRLEVEKQLGARLPTDWDSRFEELYAEAMERELSLVPGIEMVLERLSNRDPAIPSCVASNGSSRKIRRSLAVTGLLERFEGGIFSAEDVGFRGKPEPDLFIHAAAVMGATPKRCAVVEDSVPGVQAALAAGMAAFAYSGSLTPASKLGLPGVVVFHDMAELPTLLGSAG